jgi:hypothetical protein
MNRTITFKEITAGYALAGICFCLGLYFSLKVGDEHGGAFLKLFYLVGALIVLKFTFAWGRMRGFAARREDGSFIVSHVLRNLVMSAIVWMGVSLAIAPFAMFIFQQAR